MDVFIIFLVVLLVLWFLYLGPKAQEARAERERIAAADRERRAAEAERLRVERDGVLKAIRLDAPWLYIGCAYRF